MILNRRELIGGGLGAAALGKDRRPNIVMILTDQQTAAAMSMAGSTLVRTPNMDRLIAEGTRFENSWCTSPVCSPSRSTLVTGCWPHRTGVVYNGDALNSETSTVGEVLTAVGYESVWSGKWHLQRGFPGAHLPGEKPKGPQEERGFRFLPFPVARQPLVAFGDFTDEPIARAAADFISGPHDKPYFLGVSLHNPHDICYWVMDKLAPGHPSRDEFNVAPEKLPALPANHRRQPEEPEFITRCRERRYYGDENTYTRDWDELRWRRYLYGYYRMTERVDRAVGIVLDALRDSGAEKDTIVVFTSDHGEGMAAHQWVVKLMLWQEVVSVPLVFRWPGRIAAGRVDSRSLVCGADIVPTVCELAGIKPAVAVQGKSLRGALLDAKELDREAAFAQLAPDTKDSSMQARAVRTGRFKYVRFSTGERREQLFDLEKDPGETRNLAGKAESRRELERHRKLLQAEMSRVGDIMNGAF